MAQSIKCPTLDFGSGLMVLKISWLLRSSPVSGSTLSAQSLVGILSLFLSLKK